MNSFAIKLSIGLLLARCFVAQGQVTYSTATFADAFVATGSSNNPAGGDLRDFNYGSAGTMVIASAASEKGEFKSIIKFHLSGAVELFNTNYGVGNWAVTGVSLEFASNFATEGAQPNNPIFGTIKSGKFVIEWLSDDNWQEGTGNPNLPTTDGVTFNSIPALLASTHEVLMTNTYVPPGNNVHVTWPLPLSANLTADIASGGDVSFLFYAGDDQVGYLFNSYLFGRGNEPMIHVTATPGLRILSSAMSNGIFHLSGKGAVNALHQIQATTNLATGSWETIGMITANGTGLIEFDDLSATNQPQRYYRLKLP